MVKNELVSALITHLPMIIMASSHETSYIMALPLIIILVSYISNFISQLDINFRIPKSYYRYSTKMRSDRLLFCRYTIDIITSLPLFINHFYPETIKNGVINDYNRKQNKILTYLWTYYPKIRPDGGYRHKLKITRDIISKMLNENFIMPNINIDEIVDEYIYVHFYTTLEDTMIEQKMVNTKYENIVIAAKSQKILHDFITLVVNYSCHYDEHFTDRLNKATIYYDVKEKIDDIIHTNINVNKTFENVFLSEKNSKIIINSINYWQNNKLDLYHKGIPNKISLLLIGNPGSGKTSLAYALAKETRKSITSINLQNFNNQSFLRAVSCIENRIVIFDDIDTHDFTHIRKDIDDADNKSSNNIKVGNELIINTDASNNNNKKETMTLDVLLEVLDGYNYFCNCIIILTSNHPEKLDPALIRPGRINHTIKFDLCDQYQFSNIFKYYIGIDYKNLKPDFVFPNNKYNTSNLINNIILPNITDPLEILNIIQSCKQ